MSPRFHTSKSLNIHFGTGTYFCTGTCISVLGHIFLFWNIYFLYWNIHISVLEYSYFCTGIHIFVLEYTFLYWNTYFCTGTYIFVLELIFLYWNIYFCTGTYIFVLPLWATVVCRKMGKIGNADRICSDNTDHTNVLPQLIITAFVN